jgi:hypothetical protein
MQLEPLFLSVLALQVDAGIQSAEGILTYGEMEVEIKTKQHPSEITS